MKKNFGKINFLKDAIIVNTEKRIIVKQSNFKGENIDFYCINLPIKYKKIYKRLHNFNSSILYESLIYKKTSVQNIFKEIENDNIQILLLEKNNKTATLQLLPEVV